MCFHCSASSPHKSSFKLARGFTMSATCACCSVSHPTQKANAFVRRNSKDAACGISMAAACEARTRCTPVRSVLLVQSSVVIDWRHRTSKLASATPHPLGSCLVYPAKFSAYSCALVRSRAPRRPTRLAHSPESVTLRQILSQRAGEFAPWRPQRRLRASPRSSPAQPKARWQSLPPYAAPPVSCSQQSPLQPPSTSPAHRHTAAEP